MIQVPSIVPELNEEQDPRQYVYFNQHLPPAEISRIFSDYYHIRTLKILEQVAKSTNRYLVPSSCLYWKKRLELDLNFRFQVGKEVFYLVEESQITKRTIEKMEDYIKKLSD